MSRSTGTCDTSAPSRPVTQCTGASKCVPVCSPVLMSFQYQAGPRSSYRLISVSEKGTVLPNGSGSLSTGVDSDNGAVRSMISTRSSRPGTGEPSGDRESFRGDLERGGGAGRDRHVCGPSAPVE